MITKTLRNISSRQLSFYFFLNPLFLLSSLKKLLYISYLTYVTSNIKLLSRTTTKYKIKQKKNTIIIIKLKQNISNNMFLSTIILIFFRSKCKNVLCRRCMFTQLDHGKNDTISYQKGPQFHNSSFGTISSKKNNRSSCSSSFICIAFVSYIFIHSCNCYEQ